MSGESGDGDVLKDLQESEYLVPALQSVRLFLGPVYLFELRGTCSVVFLWILFV